MSDAPEFDQEFENDILAQCLRSQEYLKQAASLVDAHHFSTEEHGFVWDSIKEIWTDNRETMTPRTFAARVRRKIKAKDADQRAAILELGIELFKRKPVATSTALSELNHFVRYVQLQTTMEEAVKRLARSDVEGAWSLFKTATMRDMRPKGLLVSRWFEEFNVRLDEQKRRKEHPETFRVIPTGIKGIDKYIDGIRPGELGIIMATTGKGKSVMAVHLGYHGIIKGHGVVDIRTEMLPPAVAMRYDARFTRMFHRKFKMFDFTKEELEQLQTRWKRMHKKLNGLLRIVHCPVRSSTLDVARRAVEEMRNEMPNVSMVVFDSPEHMKPAQSYKEKRHEQADIFWDCKGWAEEDNLSIWATGQAGKQAAKGIARSEDASESYDKARIADIIITLNRPEKRSRATPKVEIGEDDAEAAKEAATVTTGADLVALMSKYRDGEDQIMVPLDADLRRMLIRDRDEATATTSE